MQIDLKIAMCCSFILSVNVPSITEHNFGLCNNTQEEELKLHIKGHRKQCFLFFFLNCPLN